MATWVLIPKQPNPFTGFANPILGWQFAGATALDAFTGCNTIFAAGWVTTMGPLATSSPSLPIWQLLISKGKVQVVANDTDYFVFDGQNVWAIPLDTVTADYTVVEQLTWDATTTAPTATAEPGQSMQVVFPEPASTDGPFTYTYTLADHTANTTAAPVAFTPTITDGNGAEIINGLTAGHEYSATVAVADNYGQTATSLASNTVTATT